MLSLFFFSALLGKYLEKDGSPDSGDLPKDKAGSRQKKEVREAGQRAMVALKVEEYYAAHTHQGKRTDLTSCQDCHEVGRAAERAADAVGVSKSYVVDAKRIRAVRPDLAEKITKGEMNIPQAKKEVWEAEAASRSVKKFNSLPPSQHIDQPDKTACRQKNGCKSHQVKPAYAVVAYRIP